MEADAGYCINKIAKKINTERRYCNEQTNFYGLVRDERVQSSEKYSGRYGYCNHCRTSWRIEGEREKRSFWPY